jgi:hypothetical protein
MTRRMLTGSILVCASCSSVAGQKTDAAATAGGGSRATNAGSGGASVGAAGAGGMKGSGAAGSGAASGIDLDASVLERNKHPSRDGH